jgi:hypothetical protein
MNAKKYCLTILFLSAVLSLNAAAQTTEFTYQGKLTDGAVPPTANYDFEFRLFSAETGGVAIAAQQRLGVSVSGGLFTVKLDFGANFDGANRWLEIAVRPAGGGSFTTLAPRQSISSAPYSIRSLNSTSADTSTNSLQLGGVAANQYVVTTDPRMTDARNPLPNSANYIQNTTALQPSSSFTISGTGAASIFNAQAQYNLLGQRIIGINGGASNLFVGMGAGAAVNIFSSQNAFFGNSAGEANTGSANSFFGAFAGQSNTTGGSNSFFGRGAGLFNTTGSDNSFFGRSAGNSNTTGADNSFFGRNAGLANTNGSGNSFFGANNGEANTSGSFNSFFGNGAGNSNTTGLSNSFFGRLAGDDNTTGINNSFFGLNAGATNASGSNNTLIGANADVVTNNLQFATAIGAGATVSTSNTVVIGRAGDQVNVSILNVGATLNAASSNFSSTAFFSGEVALFTTAPTDAPQTLCRNAAPFRRISVCSSSLRYKTAVETYANGLEIVRALRPITFNWIKSGARDIGFGAEEVEKVEPLLTFRNDQGEIEGVKYAQITTVLVNAVKEQQTQIEAQKKQLDEQNELIKRQSEELERQKTEFEALKKLVCADNPAAEICRLEK